MFYLEILSNAFIFSSHFHPGECLAQSFVCDWVARHQVLVSPLCMPLFPGCTHWCVFFFFFHKRLNKFICTFG